MGVSPLRIFIIFILFSILGFYFLSKLSVKLNPSSVLPSITVNFNWINASPYTLEHDVTSKFEAGFSILKGVKKISSKSSKGHGYITLEFDKYTDIEVARFETATIIRQLYKQLPKQASYPTININKPDEEETKPFLSYSIKANTTSFDIQEKVANQMIPIINAIEGVDKTQTYGATPKEYVIKFNNLILKTLNITKGDIIEALKNNFNKESLGSINYNNNYQSLSIKPLNTEINWHIPIKKIGGRITYLDEITSINKSQQEAQNYYRINGSNALIVSVFEKKQTNTITLAKSIDKALNTIKKNLPAGYTIIKTYDSTLILKQELNKIYERSSYTVIILLLFILFISRSLKYLVIITLSLLANISIAFLLYYIFKVELQLYSLAGITISLGIIIDNTIVMIEHIRHQDNKKVFIPILASTLTTVAALTVIYFLDDKYKANLVDFAIVIIINLTISLFITFFLVPALLEKIKVSSTKEKQWNKTLKQKFYTTYSNIISIELRFKKIMIILIILIFGLPLYTLPLKTKNNNHWYEKAYNNTYGSDWYISNLRPYVDHYLGGSLRLFNYHVFQNASYNKKEETKLYIISAMDKGSTVHQINSVFLEIENYLKQFDQIKYFTTNIYTANYAQLEISFNTETSDTSFPFMLKSGLIERVSSYGGMDWDIYGVGHAFNSSSGNNEPINLSVEARGYNYDVLNAWADSLKTELETHSRIQKVVIRENSHWSKKPSYEYRFKLDKRQIALTKLTPFEILSELKQITLSKYQDITLNINGKYTPIRFESDQSENFDFWQFKHAPLSILNTPITLNNISEINEEKEDENIYKENQEYIRLIEFQYYGSEKVGVNFLNKKLDILKTKLPLGYTLDKVDPRRWFLNQDEDNNYFHLLIIIAGAIYLICSILFESFKQPFIILSVIPISFIGVFLTFYLFDYNFDQGGLASFVLLSGITVNASIFIISDFNKLNKEFPNKNKTETYLEAFKQKILPILLTITSTILGFVPFIKDGQNEVFWFALGVGTIGGLIFSLIGILFYLPIFILKKNN